MTKSKAPEVNGKPEAAEKPVRDPSFVEYPKMLYLLGNAAEQRVVNSAEEEAAAGEDWYDQIVAPA